MKHKFVGAFTALSLTFSTTAHALPGQSFEAFQKWANSNALLTGLRPVEKLEEDYPDYGVTRSLAGADFTFEVYLNPDRTIYSEVIDYRTYRGGHRDLTFSPSNPHGLGLIRRIYGPTFVRAFQNATPVAEISLAGTLRFYRGSDYAYQVWTSHQAHSFTVLPIQDLDRVIEEWQIEADRWRGENQVDPCLSVC